MDSRSRKILAILAALCVVAGGGYVALAALGPSQTTTDASPASSAPGGAELMVRGVDPGDPRLNGRVFVVAGGKIRQRSGEDLTCERVYYAAGRGLCMRVASSGVDYEATIFDSRLQPQQTIPLTGLPSRARVSSDGRYGAMTVFVAGDAYLGTSAAFSTRTTIVDMDSGEQLGQLEQFDVSKDGQPFDAVDFNFWGITFAADPNRFYATLATGGHHYLVEGDVAAHRMRVLRDGVECPSLSPDGSQIAYKSRIGDENRWRLRVLEVATLDDHAVAGRRSIDDQAEWLDKRTLAYSDGVDVFSVPADGGGAPRRIVRDATSPVALPGPLSSG